MLTRKSSCSSSNTTTRAEPVDEMEIEVARWECHTEKGFISMQYLTTCFIAYFPKYLQPLLSPCRPYALHTFFRLVAI